MSNRVLNEGYSNQKEKFDYTKGSNICFGNQRSMGFHICVRSMFLEHNYTFVREIIEKALIKDILSIESPNIFADKFTNNICKIH